MVRADTDERGGGENRGSTDQPFLCVRLGLRPFQNAS